MLMVESIEGKLVFGVIYSIRIIVLSLPSLSLTCFASLLVANIKAKCYIPYSGKLWRGF